MELSVNTIPRIADIIGGFTFARGQSTDELRRIAENLHSQARRFFRVLAENVPRNDRDDETERWTTVIDSEAMQNLRKIGEHIEDLTVMLWERQVLRKYRGKCRYALRELEKLREQIAAFRNHDDLIYWLESQDELFSQQNNISDNLMLCAIPKRLGEMLHADFWSKGIPIALTSGTLSASGRKESACDFTHPQHACQASSRLRAAAPERD